MFNRFTFCVVLIFVSGGLLYSQNDIVENLLPKMTLQEKIGQLNQYSFGYDQTGPADEPIDVVAEIRKGNVGSILNLVGAQSTADMQRIAVNESRLKIPLLFGYDVIHGYKTIFPVPLAESCSWDLKAIEKSARIAAIEASAAGLHWTFAPMVDIARDPRWGRIMEGAGEDPYLGSLIAAARVRGFQGDNLSDPNTILACAKHYVAYGAARAGRDYNTVDVSRRSLYEVYLPPFHAALQAGVASIMSSFNEINGIPATGNYFTLKEILRDQWHFNGFVVSDWASIYEMTVHGFSKNGKQAALSAINAQVDMDMMGLAYRHNLEDLVKEGKVTESQINQAVRRILTAKARLDLFKDPFKYYNEQRQKELLLHPDHRSFAREIARKSIVLLKNDNDILPLKKNVKKIALIGPLADSQEDMLATWSAQGEAKDVLSIKKTFENYFAGKAEITYDKGCEVNSISAEEFQQAVALAKKSDIVIAVVGEDRMMSGEAHSRAYLRLPGNQLELLMALKKTGKPVVVVVISGRPLVLTDIDSNFPVIVQAWLLGVEAGNAVVDVLTGQYNPSGKLTATFPYAEGQIPVFYAHKNTGRPELEGDRYRSRYIDIPNEPLYPFGYGLSYSTFEYSDITLSSARISGNDVLKAKISVTNSSDRDGEEIVQLYIRDLVGSVTRPVKELKGFKKVLIKAGETKELEFELSVDDLAFYDQDFKWQAETGDFKICIGPNSRDIKEAVFTLTELNDYDE